MIDALLAGSTLTDRPADLCDALRDATRRVLTSANGASRAVVAMAEAEVQADPEGRITIDARGHATLRAAGGVWSAGRFEVPTLGSLRARAAARATGAPTRLILLDGEGPCTDIGAMQAAAPQGVLFQVASQFNALEAPGPAVVPVASYLRDPTQGPRAAVSAFPGTFARHYAAPAPDGGRFVQRHDGPQVELLADAFSPAVARVHNGYLVTRGVADDEALAASLVENFERIRVGLHDDVAVPLGFNWDGAVEGDRRIAQAFTSTLAGGMYSDRPIHLGALGRACAQLQRAAYLGTLLGATALGARAAVLTLIGGGVFSNPRALIWSAIVEAVEALDRDAPTGLTVIVNTRGLHALVARDEALAAVRARGGAIVTLPRAPGADPTIEA
jgi:hypothetical protein